MNIDNNLILIKGEDKTASVTSWRFDHYKPVVFITFNGQKEYPYNTAYVEFLKNPKIVELDDRIKLSADWLIVTFFVEEGTFEFMANKSSISKLEGLR